MSLQASYATEPLLELAVDVSRQMELRAKYITERPKFHVIMNNGQGETLLVEYCEFDLRSIL